MGAGTSLISSGAGATVSTAMGVAMYLEGKKMEEEAAELEKSSAAQRPIYGIPESQQRYLSETQKAILRGLPEDQRQRYLDQINRNSAYAIAGNVDRGAGLQGVAQANMTMNDANANLLTMDNQQRQQNIQNYYSALQSNAGYQDKMFAYNQDAPYQDMAAAIRSLKGAAKQAGYAGAQTVANAGSNFAGQAGTAINTINSQPTKTTDTGYLTGSYESKDSPYYTGYGRRGTAVPQMDTINTPTSVTSPYVTDNSQKVNTNTTADPTSGYGAPSYEQWLASQNNNPYYVQ